MPGRNKTITFFRHLIQLSCATERTLTEVSVYALISKTLKTLHFILFLVEKISEKKNNNLMSRLSLARQEE